MSVNISHAGKDGVILFNTERVLIFYDGVQMTFDDTKDGHFKGKKGGRIFLTTHRVILLNSSKKDKLLSFSMPFYTLKNLDLEQPVFGANYITGKVDAEQNGGWSGSAKFKMYFNKGGAIEFGKAMMLAGKLASQNGPAQPPPYNPPPNLPYYQAPPPAYTPPAGQMYGFVPHQVFPDQPPPGTVFMFNAPPPYPGMDPNLAPYPFNNQQGPYQPATNNPPPFNMAAGYSGPGQLSPYQPVGLIEAPRQSNGDQTGAPGANNSAHNGYPNQPGFPPAYPNSYPVPPGYPQAPYPAATQPPQPPFTTAYNQQQPYNPQQPQNGAHAQPSAPTFDASAAKEAEAMGGGAVGGYGGQAYFDPNNPQNVYMPTHQPPPYQPTNKKND